ncbi:MAG: hypothetical protein JWM60_1055 [Solirubrobacterales bacterium]|nr:hypothetical protein [Solirubrobacterales bacterium]
MTVALGSVAVPATSDAAIVAVGPRLDAPATVSTLEGLGYKGVDTAVPPSPGAPRGVVHTSHFGADTAIWNTTVAGDSGAMPKAGQADRIRLEGCAVRAPGGPAPLTQIHFQTLHRQGGGVKVALTSQAFEIPVCGEGGASGATVSTYSPINLCVRKGDFVGFNDEGGFVEPYYRSGVPYQVLRYAHGSTLDSFLRGGGTNNGAFFDPSETTAMDGFASRANAQLMLQVELGTGPDARYVCPGGHKDAPRALPSLRVSRQTDGINRARVVAVAIYCRPVTGCHGSARLTLPATGRAATVGHSVFSLPGNKTSHLPIKVSPEVLRLIRKHHGVNSQIEIQMGRKTIKQRVTIKIL